MPQTWEDRREYTRKWSRDKMLASQEIGEIPPVVDPDRRARASESLRSFCESYFGDVFYLPWSQIHLDVIAKLERTVEKGEIFALAMPRGSGKTTLCQIAILWAILTGRRSFAVLIAANASRAGDLLEDVKVWLETSEPLFEDFPEVCIPIRKLERISSRARGQKYHGEPTRIGWKAGELVLPTIAGSASSGACIAVAGMSGSDIRGLSHTRADGKKIRPNLVLIDDPQTRESAQSLTQCATLEKIIKSDVLGMAGPGKRLACCVTMTAVAVDDVAERLLDRRKNPEFRGERYRLMNALPESPLWEEYRKIRAAELINDGTGEQATAFYAQHRSEMDAGALPTWAARYNSDEISAIQYAMNLKFRDEASFLSEYQNQPINEDEERGSFDGEQLKAATSGRPRGFIPAESKFLTAFVDVHKNLLFWTLCAWEENFNGVLVDYGAYPKQRQARFELTKASPTLLDVNKKKGLEGAIYSGLTEVVGELFQPREREDGTAIPLARVMIDANWGPMTDLVYQFIQESSERARLSPSHGVFVGATSKPFSEYAFKRGDRAGLHWRMPFDSDRRKTRRVVVDVNYWKTFVFTRLATAPGDIGRLAIDGAASEHGLLLEHLCAEKCTAVEAKGRRVDEWKARPGADNHWLDCLVGSAVAASIEGAALPNLTPTINRQARRVSFAAMQKARRNGR